MYYERCALIPSVRAYSWCVLGVTSVVIVAGDANRTTHFERLSNIEKMSEPQRHC